MESTLLRILPPSLYDGSSLIVTCFLFLVTLALVIYQRRSQEYSFTPREQAALPPGYDGLPFLGETLLLASQKDDFLRKRRSEFGAMYRTHLFGCPSVRVSDEDSIRHILQMEGTNIRSYYPSAVRRLLGNNSIAISSGQIHRLQKRQLTHFLSNDFMTRHAPALSSVISRHLENWNRQDYVEVYPACKAIAAEIALRFLVKVEVPDSMVGEFQLLLSEFTDNFFCFPFYLPGTGYYKAWNAKEKLKARLGKLMQNEKISTDNTSTQTADSSAHPLLKTRNKEDTLEQMFELLFVGGDNNGSSMFIISNILSRHPEVVQKARRELDEAGMLSNDDMTSGINLEQVRSLHYIRAVVKECLRVIPPVGGVFRTVNQGFDFNGYHIPKGWRIIAGIRETHENDPGLSDPRQFNPDRWLNGHSKPTFLTFGAGSRKCPGQLFADVVLEIFVVELVMNWNLQIVKDSKLTMFPNVKPKDSLLIKLNRSSD